ncbi:MAG: hypothetical protein OXG53_13245 [Chloroflexi bacterium]|nr:hypothetical protein [Chloroflexota bacterium]
MTSRFPPSVRRVVRCLIIAAAAAILTACRSDEPQQTATAVYQDSVVNIQALRATATVARARVQTTLDYAGTRVGQAESARAFLVSNLISLGTEAAHIEENLAQLEQIATPVSFNTPAEQASGATTAVAPPSKPRPGAIVTPPVVTPAPTATESGPRLENITMASGVNEFECARDVNPRFTPASAAIYVVGRAYRIPAGATISSAWRRAGEDVVSFSFHREHEINDNCIWFYIDQTDTPFTVGSWSVEISVDGVPLSSPVAFQIVAN